jgi:putative ABC transport system substrate-binding protein
VAFLFNPATAPYEYYLSSFKAAARSFAVEAIAAPVRDRSELEPVITALARAPNGGLVLMTDTFLLNHREEITSLAVRYRLPAVYPYRAFSEAGGLLSYGNDTRDNFRRAASYVDRSSKAQSRASFPSKRRSSSIWRSTSKPPRRSAWKSHRRCSPAPTR